MNTLEPITIHTDGGSRGNPGPAAVGIVIDRGDVRVTQFGRAIGETTNNVAEYTAVIDALEWLIANNEKGSVIRFVLDSELVVNQMNGKYRIKDPHLRELSLKARILESELGIPVTFSAVRREFNHDADTMVNAALDRAGE